MAGTRVFALCALLLTSFCIAAQQQFPPTTAEDLVRIGIAQNRDLLAIRERVAEARGTVTQAGVRPSPSINARGVTGRPLGTVGEEQYGAEYSQTVETFGKRSKRIDVASFEVTQAEAELQARSAELAFAIRTGLADRFAELQKIKLFGELIGLNQEALRLTDARVQEGDAARLDANLLRVEVNRAQVLERSAQSRLSAAELTLRRLTGLRADQSLPEVSIPVPGTQTLEAMKQVALSTRADLGAARIAEEQGQASIGLARANAKPDLSFTAGYTKQNSQFDGLYGQTATGATAPLRDRDDLLTFGVSIPLRTSRSTRGDVESATARTSGARYRREYLQQTIPLEVEAAYQQWTTAQQSLQALQTGVVDLSTENLRVIQEAYKLGQLRLLDVVNEQRRLLDNRLALIDAQSDAAKGWAEVERVIGGNLP